MRVISVRLHNVFRFGLEDNYVNFDDLFSNGVSVAMISGATNGDKNLSNGAGKSSIVEAVYWAFFERLPRIMDGGSGKQGVAVSEIVRKDDNGLIPSDVRESFVEVEFETRDGDRWVLKRGRQVKKSGKLTPIIDLRNVTSGQSFSESSSVFESTIARIVRLNHQSFLNATIFAQNNAGRFLEGTDGERKDILMDLRGVAVIDDMLKVLREQWKRECDRDITSNDAKIAVLRSRVENTSPELIRKEKMEMAATIEVLEREITTLEKIAAEAVKSASEASSGRNMSAEAVNKAKASLDKIVESGAAARSEADSRISDAKSSIEAAKRRLLDKKETVKQLSDRLALAEAVGKNFSEKDLLDKLSAINKAKTEKTALDAESSGINEKIGGIKGRAVSLKSTIEGSESKRKKILDLKGSGGVCGDVVCDKCGSLLTAEHLAQELKNIESAIEIHNSDKASLEREYADLNSALSKCRTKIKSLSSVIESESDVSVGLEKLKAANAEIVKVRPLHSKAVSELPGYESELLAEQQKLAAAENVKKTLEARQEIERSVFAADIVKAENSLETAKAHLEKAESVAKSAASDVKTATSRKSGLYSAIAVADEKLASADRDKAEIEALIAAGVKLSAKMARIQYFDKLLSTRIKTKAAESCVPLISHYANEFLTILKSTARLHFGDEKSELAVRLVGASAPVYTLLSGGEKEAVRLAVNMALSMLTLGGVSEIPDMIFLDEVFAPLDVATKENVFVLLSRLNRNFKRICVISHDQVTAERVGASITVNKIDGKSRIELEA